MIHDLLIMSRSLEQRTLKVALQKLSWGVLCSAFMLGSAQAGKEEALKEAADAIAKLPVKAGCEVGGNPDALQSLLKNAAPFANPPVYDFTNGDPLVADLQVSYQQPVLAGCETHLRQFAGHAYDQRPVAPTMLIRPDQTYQANITNTLPKDKADGLAVRAQNGHDLHSALGSHGGQSTIFGYVPPEKLDVNHNTPGNFNVTNLHTHGWHVKPTENHDNIFAAIGPGDPPYLQQVHLPEDHVAGTFWYHAHVHGSTTIQVASGMAGALIVKDPTKGLDAIPEIAAAKDFIFVLQQLAYDTQGVIESYDNLQQKHYSGLNRPVFVNGQAYPVIQMSPGEVQRWRFIHAGITDGIKPALVSAAELMNTSPTTIPLYEIALDGLPTGTMPQINNATMSPGYRVDVLAQLPNAKPGETYYIIDSGQSYYTTQPMVNMRYILAQISVGDGHPEAHTLPNLAQIAQAKADYVYGSYHANSLDPYADMGPLNDVSDQELMTGKQQTVHFFATNTYTCPEFGGSCTPCSELSSCNPKRVYMVCDGKDSNNYWACQNFNPSADYARTLALDTASQWQVSGDANQNNHTFHIHVNPFQVQRKFVDNSTGAMGEQWVWKDTLKAPVVADTPTAIPALLKSRYTDFTGAFVQHCHVLNHEDQGMMQVVEIRPSDQDLKDNPKEAGDAVLKALR